MIEKNAIITLAWLELGEQNQLYNNNITDRQTIASTLFDAVIDEIALDANFSFNSKTIQLTKNLQEKNFRDEYRYNKPADYISTIWTSDNRARMENEFFYSTQDELQLCYCYDMPLTEYPSYIKRYLVLSLALKLASAFDMYKDKISYIMARKVDEMNTIIANEGLPFEIER